MAFPCSKIPSAVGYFGPTGSAYSWAGRNVMRITAYDGAQWRVERLEKVLRIVGRIYDITRAQMDQIVDEVADDRGELHITWKHDHTYAQERAFAIAWELCKELPSKVFHHIEGGF